MSVLCLELRQGRIYRIPSAFWNDSQMWFMTKTAILLETDLSNHSYEDQRSKMPNEGSA